MTVFPKRLGPLELTGDLGTGGTARVYEGYRLCAGGVRARVAVKCLRTDRAWDERAVARFVLEARLNSYLMHPNIISIHDFITHRGVPSIVMEFVDGCDLAQLLGALSQRGAALPPDLVVDMLRQLLLGLDYAHRATDSEGQPLCLVHRDLKPANIFLSRQGMIKISDFGIAKSRISTAETTVGVFRGTPAYCSPEQFRGEVSTPATDLFAVGLLLYEMLTGQQLFRHRSLSELATLMAGFDPARVAAGLPPSLAPFGPFLERSLALGLAERFGTAKQALEATEALHRVYPLLTQPRAFLQPLLQDIAAARALGREGEGQTGPTAGGSGVQWVPPSEDPIRGLMGADQRATLEGAFAPAPSRLSPKTAPPRSPLSPAAALGGLGVLALLALYAVGLGPLREEPTSQPSGAEAALAHRGEGPSPRAPQLGEVDALVVAALGPGESEALTPAATLRGEDHPAPVKEAAPLPLAPPAEAEAASPRRAPRLRVAAARPVSAAEPEPRDGSERTARPSTSPADVAVPLLISTLPPDRTISIDGGAASPVPWRGALTPGSHEIAFFCEGYRHAMAMELRDGGERRIVWDCPGRAEFRPERMLE